MSFVAGDTASKIVVTLLNQDGTPRNLTGTTVTLKARRGDGSLLSVGMTVTNPTGGVAEYTFTAGQLLDGPMRIEVEVSSGGSVVSTCEAFSYIVRGKV